MKAYLEEGFEWVFEQPADISGEGRVYADGTEYFGCKGRSYAPASDRMGAPSLDPLAWDLKYNGSTLELTWVNFNANCATHGFENWMVYGENSTIDFFLDEVYIPGLDFATCTCPYDVTGTYTDIKAGEYTLNFHHYDKIYSVKVTLADGMDTHYVSSDLTGIRQISAADKVMRVIDGDVLKCTAEGAYTIEIIGSDGLTPLRINSDGPTEISLNNLTPGIYIARMTNKDGVVSTYRFSR